MRINFYFDKEVMEYLDQNSQKTTQETTQENYTLLNEVQRKIIKFIKSNPAITQKEIAQKFAKANFAQTNFLKFSILNIKLK